MKGETLKQMDKLFFQEAIKISDPGLFKCDKCGAPLIVSQNNEFGWEYIDGFWKHNCSHLKNDIDFRENERRLNP